MDGQRVGVRLWQCPNCGQTHFGFTPPDLCDFCADFTTWRRYDFAPFNGQPARYIQLPLPLIYYDDDTPDGS